MRMQPQPLGRLAEDLSDPARAERRHRVGFAAWDEGVVLLSARHADQVVEERVVRFQVFVGYGPVCEGAPLRQHAGSPAFAYVGEVLEMVRMVAPEPGAVVDDGTAYAVHHASEREGGLAGGLALVSSP